MEPLYHPMTARRLGAIKPQPASYIFTGQPGTGRRLAATTLAMRLNCANGGGDACAICQNIKAGSFADLKVVDESTVVGIDQIKDLQQALSQRPFSSSTTRMIIIEADNGMTREAQSRLLKTLEEPPGQTIIVIITADVSSFLSTVLSRCQIVGFVQPSTEQIKLYLQKQLTPTEVQSIEQLRPASVGQALSLARDAEARRIRKEEIDYAKAFLDAAVFNRLVMSGQVKSKSRAIALTSLMASLLPRSAKALPGMGALEQAQSQLLANVGPRVALEALALSL